MNNKEILNTQKEAFKLKGAQQIENKMYYEMLTQFVEELLQLEQQVERLKEYSELRVKWLVYQNQWLEIMEAIEESLALLAQESFEKVKGKKLYEAVDETIADLEDWIELVNESLEDDHQLGYLEAWDIGVFF